MTFTIKTDFYLKHSTFSTNVYTKPYNYSVTKEVTYYLTFKKNFRFIPIAIQLLPRETKMGINFMKHKILKVHNFYSFMPINFQRYSLFQVLLMCALCWV